MYYDYHKKNCGIYQGMGVMRQTSNTHFSKKAILGKVKALFLAIG
jgi:hypothetical protein